MEYFWEQRLEMLLVFPWKCSQENEYGKITNYVSPKGRKWFDKEPLGSWTDDMHLTLAVARALISDRGFTMESQVEQHIKAMEINTSGWGPTTKESIQALARGVSYKESGQWKAPVDGKGARGVGNGVCMKNAPLAAYFKSKPLEWQIVKAAADLVDFTAMTHRTSIAVSSCNAQFFVVLYCLGITPQQFNPKVFTFKAVSAARNGEKHFPETLTDNLANRFETLMLPRTTEKLDEDYGRGSSYVFNSQPFAYAHFVANHDNINALYDVVSAGGDTDTMPWLVRYWEPCTAPAYSQIIY